MRGAIPPLSQYIVMAWCLVKRRNNFKCLPVLPLRDYVGLKQRTQGKRGSAFSLKSREPNFIFNISISCVRQDTEGLYGE